MTFQVAGQRPQYCMEIYRNEAWVWATHHWPSAYGQTTSIASGWPVSRQSSDVLIATRDPSAQMAPTTRPSLLTHQVVGLSAGACAARGRVPAQRRQRLAEPSPL